MLHGVCVFELHIAWMGFIVELGDLATVSLSVPICGLPIPNSRNGICEFPALVSCTSADGLFPRKNILGGCICYGESSHDGHIWAIFLWGDYHHQVIFCPIQHSYETRHWTYRVIIRMVVYCCSFMFPNWHGELKQRNFSWFAFFVLWASFPWCFSWVCYKGALLEWQLWYIAAIWAVVVAKQDLLGNQTWPYWCLVLSTAFLQRVSMIWMERADGKLSYTIAFAP